MGRAGPSPGPCTGRWAGYLLKLRSPVWDTGQTDLNSRVFPPMFMVEIYDIA